MFSRQAIARQTAIVPLLLLPFFLKPVLAAPLILNATELDSVNAGYVNLYGHASAEAFGDIAIADIYVDTAQTIVHKENGLIYTISTVTANAAAIGERVQTAVSAGFDTDEQIVSLDIDYTSAGGVLHDLEPVLTAGKLLPVNKKPAQKPAQRHHPKKHNKKKPARKKSANRHHKKKNSGKRHGNGNRKHNKKRQRQKPTAKRAKNKQTKPVVYQNKTVTLTLVTVQPKH